jgi:anti-sigma factor RsiW
LARRKTALKEVVRIMPKCKYTRQVSAFHDKEVSRSELREMQVHLPQCTECTGALAELERLSNLVDRTTSDPVPIGVSVRLRERRDRVEGNDLLPAARLLAGVATVLLVLSLSISLLSGQWGKDRSLSGRYWEDIAVAREMDADALEEPEVELTQWVVAGLTERKAR